MDKSASLLSFYSRVAVLCGCIIASSLVAPRARAATPDLTPLEIQTSPTTGRTSFVTAAGGGPIDVTPANGRQSPNADDFLRQYGHALGVTDPAQQLRQSKVHTDTLNTTHSTYEQIERGIPVFSGVLKTHQDSQGRFVSANGHFRSVPAKLNLVPTLGAQLAFQLAAAEAGIVEATVEQNELVIVDPGWYGDRPIGAHLAYHVIVSDSTAARRQALFIDAHTGDVLDQWSVLYTAKNRAIHNGASTSFLPGVLARGEGAPAVVGPADVNRAYDYYGDTYDYFFRAFGRDSIDALGLTIVATVQSTAPGPCPNAYWNGTQMAFCAATLADDVVAHELMHGITQYTANLIYQNQSGQLNEAYSDIFGELVDLFNGNAAFVGTPGGTAWPTHPTGAGRDAPNGLRTPSCSNSPSFTDGVRWLLGEDAGAFGGAIRDMWNPPCMQDPNRAYSPLQTCNLNDNGGVHSGSGIANHAFAILTDGKFFNAQDVTGIGPIKAGAVWYRALTTYLTVASDYPDAYAALNQAARDLIGTTPKDPRTGGPSDSTFTQTDMLQVNRSLHAVEMSLDGLCGWTVDILSPTPVQLPAPRIPLFADNFEQGNRGWNVSNTNPPTPYNWFLRSSLPFQRPGTAWFCENRNVGNCQSVVEAGVHSLFSPPIRLPVGPLLNPTLMFTHYVATEPNYDGCNVKFRVDNGLWKPIPLTNFTFNGYNALLYFSAQGNTNPMAGQHAWAGAGGRWGTTTINMTPFAAPGSLMELRFDLGKDGCYGIQGWFLDDVEFYITNSFEDCNNNGVYDRVDIAQGTSIDCNLDLLPDECAVPMSISVSLAEQVQTGMSSVPLAQDLTISGGSQPYTYNWQIVSGPSMTGLSAANVRNPTFTPDAEGVYTLRCTVGDSGPQPCTDSFELTVTSEYLKANAGADVISCGAGASITLGASPTARGGRPPYSYTWTVLGGSATLDPDSRIEPNPAVSSPLPDDCLFQLRVSDSSNPPVVVEDTVALVVTSAMKIVTGDYSKYHSIVAKGEVLRPGSQFHIEGGKLPYSIDWSIDPADGGTVQNSSTMDPRLIFLKPGFYSVQLAVADSAGCRIDSRMSLTVAESGAVLDSAGLSVPPMCGMFGSTGAASLVGLACGLATVRRSPRSRSARPHRS
jgi:Zn-dependent metalloprotease/PKD repeat protein